ncbi:DUF6653 family protein [Oceanicola sp. S124]|uniref:DUF6653 family protein n=1 Tax=Oceanicola sp. S124 TaxID=1042378 RepID=UPI0002558162|nr:DUF6653 family protein [Oceanicola sp. S124]
MADAGRLSERLMLMDEAAWARHANPWSGWSRLATLPLLSLAVWSRVWIGAWAWAPVALVLTWVWVNPRLFPVPRRTDNWMSQGVLGERVWLARRKVPIPAHHARAAMILSGLSGGGAMVLGLGLWALSPGWTVAGLVLSMGAKLWFLDRMVWLRQDMAGEG